MTAAKVTDIVSKLLGRSGTSRRRQYPLIFRSKRKMHRRYWQFQSQNAQIFGYIYQRHKWPKSWSSMEDPSRSSRKESVRSSFSRTVRRKAIWESSIGTRLEKVPNWECLFVNRETGLFLLVYVDDIKTGGKTENMGPILKVLMKDVALWELTSCLDHVYLGCTLRECQISKGIVANYSDMFESRISAGAKENCRPELQGNLMQKTYLLGPTTWKAMQRNVWTDIANLWIKQLNNFSKSQHSAWKTINPNKKKMS